MTLEHECHETCASSVRLHTPKVCVTDYEPPMLGQHNPSGISGKGRLLKSSPLSHQQLNHTIIR